MTILTDEEKQSIKSMVKDDLIMLHFSLGRGICNMFGLNSDNTVLLDNRCADDVSMEIIERLWGNYLMMELVIGYGLRCTQ